MAVSLAGSISRAISGYNKDIRTHERAISTGKKTLSQLNPADLVQISSLFRATQGLGGARANIDIAIQDLNTLANGIQNQLDIVNKAYQLAETVVTNVNLTAADRTNMNLQYQALVGGGGAIQSAAAATTDINGTALIGNGAAQAINAIVATNPATVNAFAAIDSTQATLFAGPAAAANAAAVLPAGSAGAIVDLTTVANASALINTDPLITNLVTTLNNAIAAGAGATTLATEIVRGAAAAASAAPLGYVGAGPAVGGVTGEHYLSALISPPAAAATDATVVAFANAFRATRVATLPAVAVAVAGAGTSSRGDGGNIALALTTGASQATQNMADAILGVVANKFAAAVAAGVARTAAQIVTDEQAVVVTSPFIAAQTPVLSSAQGILSNYLAKIENQIDLLSSISDSLGDASDAAADTAKEIADTDPIEAANAIKNNQGAKNLLAGLLTNDAQDANNVMNYARGILALPV